jgi:hypothetical protein
MPDIICIARSVFVVELVAVTVMFWLGPAGIVNEYHPSLRNVPEMHEIAGLVPSEVKSVIV